MKKIGIYPGNFQPATRAHLEVYKRLKSMVGVDSFIATTDREPTPEAPLNFGDKEQIWVRHGVPASHIVQISTLPVDDAVKAAEWRPKEVLTNFSGEHTIVICVFNEKEAELFARRKGKVNTSNGMTAKTVKEVRDIMKELSGVKSSDKNSTGGENREAWLNPDGTPQYFQPYKANEHDLKPFNEHAYIVVLDDSRIQGKPVSTTNIRDVLGSPRYNDDQKKKFFRWVFGWFDVGLYQLVTTKFKSAHQVALPAEPRQSSATDIATEPTPTKPASIPISSKKRIEEMVYDVLEEIMDEDYSTTINTPDSTDNMTAGVDGEKSLAQQRADAAKQKQDLVTQKGQAERDLKGLETDLKWKQSDILRKRKDELPNKRKELDDLNKQISAASSTTSTTVSNN